MNLHTLFLVCCALLFTFGLAQEDECKNAPAEFTRVLLEAVNERRRNSDLEDLKYDCFLGKRVLSGVFEGRSPLMFVGKSKYESTWEVAVRAAVEEAQNSGLMFLPDAKVVGCHVRLETSTDTGAHTLFFECTVDKQAIR